MFLYHACFVYFSDRTHARVYMCITVRVFGYSCLHPRADDFARRSSQSLMTSISFTADVTGALFLRIPVFIGVFRGRQSNSTLVVSQTDSEKVSVCLSVCPHEGHSMVTYGQIYFETSTPMPHASGRSPRRGDRHMAQTTPHRVPCVWSYQS